MEQLTFYRALKQFCIEKKAECTACCMRLYCYTPPCEKTDFMVNEVTEYLKQSGHIHRVVDNHLDHCTDMNQMPCPCNVDMSTALGYEPR